MYINYILYRHGEFVNDDFAHIFRFAQPLFRRELKTAESFEILWRKADRQPVLHQSVLLIEPCIRKISVIL